MRSVGPHCNTAFSGLGPAGGTGGEDNQGGVIGRLCCQTLIDKAWVGAQGIASQCNDLLKIVKPFAIVFAQPARVDDDDGL
jgi:hypothetical protein